MSTHAYLERARQAGLLDEVRGHRYVADLYEDPFTGRRQILVEYCDAGLPGDAAGLGALCARLRERHATAESVLLRIPGGAPLPAPWRPRFTYLRHHHRSSAGPAASVGAVGVRPAGPGDRDRIHQWLTMAFRNTYEGREVDERHPAIRDLMAAPDRLSFIAHAAGKPIGHGTVLTDQRDEITGEEFAELVDILIDDEEHRREAISALVAVIAEVTRGRRLCGHVVHPHQPAQARRADAVLKSLLRTDWTVDHAFWENAW
ncbi:GNAT family N-acetyltransferase [Streptomyces shenzhenensis]|uniref:GNAT family N-acetyltransferase n=1 Tax=Streptomyces shenzhenensis TaxID=943815 RepID=UPI0033D49006